MQFRLFTELSDWPQFRRQRSHVFRDGAVPSDRHGWVWPPVRRRLRFWQPSTLQRTLLWPGNTTWKLIYVPMFHLSFIELTILDLERPGLPKKASRLQIPLELSAERIFSISNGLSRRASRGVAETLCHLYLSSPIESTPKTGVARSLGSGMIAQRGVGHFMWLIRLN